MAKHSALSASSTERWWNCPGSVNACANLPNPTTVYAAEGTVAHAIAEEWLRKGKRPDKEGTIIVQDGFEIEVTEQMMDHCEEYVEYVRKVMAEYGPRAIVRFEQKIELKEVNAVMFGTTDTVIEVPFVVIDIFDFKYGQGKRVSAWKNKQEMYYALGVALKTDCARFRLHICQPRVEDGFTMYEGTMQELLEFEAELRKKAELALSPTAPLVPGDWCKSTFCPNRTSCTALQQLARDVTVRDFEDVPAVGILTVEQIQRVLKYEDTVKDWMARVKDYAKELMMTGVEIPGYKVVESIGNAAWVDEGAVVAEFEDEFGDKLYKKDLISPSQFEKLVGKKRLGKTFRDDYTQRPVTGYKIVELDEKGEAVKKIKAQEDF